MSGGIDLPSLMRQVRKELIVMYYLKLEPTGGIDIVEIEGDKMQGWYKEIDCDLVEIVRAKHLPEPYVIICDEEFLLKSEPIFNPIASLLYGVRDHGQPICGTVLIGKDRYTDDGIETIGYSLKEAQKVVGHILDAILSV